jgi:nitroimidazol reductase NimA-like FMN-containing flavoprotein (pyridoxamine 5'-phosphate oxidase superfamily)
MSDRASDKPVFEPMDEAECLRLISAGGIGRLAYAGRFGLTVLPVNYKLHDGAIVFRTAEHSPTGEDLQTGIAHAEYEVAFEIDEIDPAARLAWSVLIHGPAHPMTSPAERAAVVESGVEPWAPGQRDYAIRITPKRVTGRRIRGADA